MLRSLQLILPSCPADRRCPRSFNFNAQVIPSLPTAERPPSVQLNYKTAVSAIISCFFLVIPLAVATTSPVFHGHVFKNSLRTGALSAVSRHPSMLPGVGWHMRRRGIAPNIFVNSDRCPARTGSQPLRIGFGLGLPIIDDILEPIEMLWEFYTARDEIQEQMLANAGKFLKKQSVQFLGFTGAAVAGAEILARLGFIGDKGEGLKQYVKENERLKARLRKMDDAIDEQIPGVIARTCRSCFRRYRDLPERYKFTIAFTTGSMVQQTLINAAVSAIKLCVGTFVVLETLAFTGVIGEPGESIVEWVEDHNEIKGRVGERWANKAKRFRQSCRKYLSFDGVVELYEAAVDEEKVATFGLGLGMFAGSVV